MCSIRRWSSPCRIIPRLWMIDPVMIMQSFIHCYFFVSTEQANCLLLHFVHMYHVSLVLFPWISRFSNHWHSGLWRRSCSIGGVRADRPTSYLSITDTLMQGSTNRILAKTAGNRAIHSRQPPRSPILNQTRLAYQHLDAYYREIATCIACTYIHIQIQYTVHSHSN